MMLYKTIFSQNSSSSSIEFCLKLATFFILFKVQEPVISCFLLCCGFLFVCFKVSISLIHLSLHNITVYVQERNSCCKPNPYSLIFHHLGASSVVFSITASAFYSAVALKSKFPTNLPFKACQIHLYWTWTLRLHTHHHPAEMGA